jgi:hypothetical protein
MEMLVVGFWPIHPFEYSTVQVKHNERQRGRV